MIVILHDDGIEQNAALRRSETDVDTGRGAGVGQRAVTELLHRFIALRAFLRFAFLGPLLHFAQPFQVATGQSGQVLKRPGGAEADEAIRAERVGDATARRPAVTGDDAPAAAPSHAA